MKHLKQALSALLALLLLCCACSGVSSTGEPSADAARTNVTAAAPLAQPSGTSGFTDVEPGA